MILDLFFFSLWKAVYIHSSGSLNVASLNVKTHVHTFWNVFLNSLLLLSPFYLSSFVELFIHILNLFLNCFFISLRVSLFFSLSTILSQKLPWLFVKLCFCFMVAISYISKDANADFLFLSYFLPKWSVSSKLVVSPPCLFWSLY